MMPRQLIPYILCGVAVLIIFIFMLWPGLRKPFISFMPDAVEVEMEYNKQRGG